ncbi:MAG TPA: aldolase/citrate lyase family protein [Ramlibacter sp.]|nr:aldolase/citrate lyase family protein [Ramlibacter sp.]
MVHNLALDSLRAGGTALGVVIRHERGPHIARAMRASGFEWLFMDLEHSAMPLDAVAAISIASLDAGITPMVRVPAMDLGTAIRVLDTGALGVLMPHVENADEARAIADAFRYPPIGHRSISSTLPQFHFQSPPMLEACRALDAATLVGVMLETPGSVENAEAIAAVPGIDLLFIGAVDLTAEAGLHGQFDHPRVQAMFEQVVHAARRHGKLVGIGGIGDDAILARCHAMGMHLILLGTDLGYMMAAASARTRGLRAAMGTARD